MHIFQLRQPLMLMNNYYGERLCFIFAWQGLYAKLLSALMIPALAAEAALLVAHHLGRHEDTIQGIVLLSFSYILVLWGAVAFRTWEREQGFFTQLWHCQHNSDHSIIKPDFVGEWKPSAIDRNMREKSQDERLFVARKVASALVTLICAAIVTFFNHAWFIVWEGNMRMVANTLLAIQMYVLGELFAWAAERLTHWENHKYQGGHYNSYVMKLFCFYFVNNYYPFIHMIFFQENTKAGCPPQGCLLMARTQLIQVYLILVLVSLGKALMVDWRAHLFVAWEEHMARREAGGDKLTLLEKQRVFGEFKEREQVELMVELVISLGFVTLFGALAPGTVVLCCIVFVFHMRVSSFLLTHCLQRPFPWHLAGIGSWMVAIDVMRTLGVLLTGYLMVAHKESPFVSATLSAKLSAYLIFVVSAVVLREIVALLLPAPDETTHVLSLRRQHVESRICKAVLSQRKEDTPRKTGLHELEEASPSLSAKSPVCAGSLPGGLSGHRFDWKTIPNLKPRGNYASKTY